MKFGTLSVVFAERADLGVKFLVSLGPCGATHTSGTHGVALDLTDKQSETCKALHTLPVFA